VSDKASTIGDAVLSVDGWSRQGQPTISDVSFDLHRGEILSLFGPRGCGADLIADGLGGRLTGFRGRLTIHGADRGPFATPRESQAVGIGYVPPERKRDGLVLHMSIQSNISLLVLGTMSRLGIIDRGAEARLAREWRDTLDVRSRSIGQSVESLSGGNQQKVLLASRLVSRPDLLVLNEPTRGVDVGTRAQIHAYLKEEARRGTAVLWVTSDIEEAVLVSDRMLVMRDGDVVGELRGQEISQAEALALGTGPVRA
jgi:ABC-type sugar transport system ATPase subunit